MTIINSMLRVVSMTGFEALVSKVLKSKPRAVITGCLLSVTDPEGNVIEAVEDSNLWSHCWFFVVHVWFKII